MLQNKEVIRRVEEICKRPVGWALPAFFIAFLISSPCQSVFQSVTVRVTKVWWKDAAE